MAGAQTLRVEGCVIVSADGMLADAEGHMPPALLFPGDQRWFESALDRADLVVHGRHSGEDQPRSPERRRLVLTRAVPQLTDDPANPRVRLWNPAGLAFEDACARTGLRSGIAMVIGGPAVFRMFLDRYDTFWLSHAPHVRLPGGRHAFDLPGRTPDDILRAHGLTPGETRLLDPAHDVTLTAWHRAR